MIPEALNDWVDILVYSTLIPILLFIVFYLRRSPWWVTDLGVTQLSSKIAQLLVYLVIGSSLFFGPDYDLRPIVRVLGYGPVLLIAWLDFGNLLRYQNHFPHSRAIAKKTSPRPSVWTMLKRYFRPPVD